MSLLVTIDICKLEISSFQKNEKNHPNVNQKLSNSMFLHNFFSVESESDLRIVPKYQNIKISSYFGYYFTVSTLLIYFNDFL